MDPVKGPPNEFGNHGEVVTSQGKPVLHGGFLGLQTLNLRKLSDIVYRFTGPKIAVTGHFLTVVRVLDRFMKPYRILSGTMKHRLLIFDIQTIFPKMIMVVPYALVTGNLGQFRECDASSRIRFDVVGFPIDGDRGGARFTRTHIGFIVMKKLNGGEWPGYLSYVPRIGIILVKTVIIKSGSHSIV